MTNSRLTALFVVCTLLVSACSSPSSSVTSPTNFEPPPGAYRFSFAALKPETGFAGMSVTPKAIPEGTFAADISVRLQGLRVNTTYLLQRAQEGVGGRPLGADGICQRAQGLAPWSSSDPAALAFQTMPLPATGPIISVTTAANGDGAIDFEFRAVMILAGSTNDVMFRLVDNDVSPTSEFRSPCLLITAR
jgi:hypothetical protein